MSGRKPFAGKGVKIVSKSDMARTFESVFHFVRYDTVTGSPHQISLELL